MRNPEPDPKPEGDQGASKPAEDPVTEAAEQAEADAVEAEEGDDGEDEAGE